MKPISLTILLYLIFNLSSLKVNAQNIDSKNKNGSEYEKLEPIIGNWITEGNTVPDNATKPVKVVASDVYEWGPGRMFIIHYAYGRIGDNGGGGVEIIRYDKANRKYLTYFINSMGEVVEEELTINGNKWTWAGSKTRCTAVLSQDGKILSAYHESSVDGKKWLPAFDVKLFKAN